MSRRSIPFRPEAGTSSRFILPVLSSDRRLPTTEREIQRNEETSPSTNRGPGEGLCKVQICDRAEYFVQAAYLHRGW